ncbi:MAG: T9SS type A sorting domain-containing protein [Sphingobacteriales bacterium JAD_PAG50586_3]|nr:MAG: T9SS type A sorting domain-containing protein [Sphingobacteriales bacterium JAD_PAG50586_3]
MAVYNGELYISGGWMDCYPGLGSLVKWNGSQWSVIPGFNLQAQIGVTDIEVYQDKLIIAGRFHKPGGYEGNCIMAWDGQQFYDMENGITALSTPQQYYWGGTNDMMIVNDNLFIVGEFIEVGGSPISRVSWWDGNHWCGFTWDYSQYIPTAIGHINNDIYIGSGAYRFINGIDYNYIIKLPSLDSANICSDGTLASVSTQPFNNPIKIYPNPVTDNLTLEYNLDKASNFKFALYDVLGNIIYQEEKPNAYGYYYYSIPTLNLANGLYIARIELNGNSMVKKIIKQ